MTGKIITGIKTFSIYPGALIYFVFEDLLKNDKNLKFLDEKLNQDLSKKFKKLEFEAKENQMVIIEKKENEVVIVIGTGKSKDFDLVKFKNILANVFIKLRQLRIDQVYIYYSEILGKDLFSVGENLALAYYLANYSFVQFKSEKEKAKTHYIKELRFYFDKVGVNGNSPIQEDLNKGIEFGKTISDGIYLTRDLVNQPASHVTPQVLVETAFEIEKQSKGVIKVEVLDKDECQRLGMGAFLGVAQGSDKEPKFIILKFSPSVIPNLFRDPGKKQMLKPVQHDKKRNKSICLIGKSITFDSGGLSLKPASAMEDMKIDMSGGATVLGVFKILAGMEDLYSLPTVYGILPACENMPSGNALKPGDVVRSVNGKTTEVLNTDAEGRLTLADALSYAEKYLKPDLMIDLATLTGACMVALGNDITGLFGNNEKVINEFSEVAKQNGDELWHLPLYKPYMKQIKSDIADLKNIGGGHYGGAITAALYLSEFVEKTDWLHLDIAGPAHNSGEAKGVTPKGGTGWGVVSLVNFIKNYS